MIRDIILFYTLDKSEVIEKVAKELPVICDAADFIVKTTRQELVRTTTSERTTSAATSSAVEEREENDLSYESSTSSDDDNTQSPRASSSNRPRITRETLEHAVRGAAQSNNSLSNIAQRQQEAGSDGASGRNNPILPNDLSNAITRAMSSITTPATGSSSAENPPVESMETSTVDTESSFTDLPEMYRTHIYAEQMQTMRHMGLTNDSLNLSVLMMTNGGLENAVNLVFAMGDSTQS
ncbi:UBL7 family protein [Megaselia abdita]